MASSSAIASRRNGPTSSWSLPQRLRNFTRMRCPMAPGCCASPLRAANSRLSSLPGRCSRAPEPRLALYLDDLYVGQTFASDPHLLDAEQIKKFAAEFDPQPFHLSEDGAAGTMFGSLAASGWHTAALTMRMLVESVPLADGLVGAELQLAW